MYNPVSTIRIQFHREFTFADFRKLIPFFSSMGVGTIYASPIFHAVAGSNHGYDVIDPYVINPEIGTIDEFRQIIHELRTHNIGWLQDIVPNHMAFHPSNAMLMDVLENGSESKYATFFETGFASDFFASRIMVPVLNASLEDAIGSGKIKIIDDGKLFFEYENNRYPLNERSKKLLSGKTDYNNDHQLLIEVANVQYYDLCDWRLTNKKVNYRRFFTVNGLICLNMQSAEVFSRYHSFARSMIKEKLIDGVRVDHIDGLFDPEEYLVRLRDLAGPETYIIVEKILEPHEELPTGWPIQGTSGYEFLAVVNNLFTWTRAEAKFTKFYDDIIGKRKSFEERVREKKSKILFEHMAGELDNLARYYVQSGVGPDDELLKNTIASFLIHCPQYRFYGNSFPLSKGERQMIEDVLDDVRRDKQLKTKDSLLDEAFIEKPEEGNETFNGIAADFYRRLMQFTGPLMAKGVEDTLMYTFTRFIGHNEVGDSPEEFGTTIQSFHRSMQDRQQHWPLAMNATATHDTKRGEDVRMRLSVITDLADEWIGLVQFWLTLDDVDSQEHLDASEKYFIYQTLIGSFPMDGDTSALLPRLDEYFVKSFREAKRHTDWNEPDEAFEKAVHTYVRSLFDDRRFLDGFIPFEQKVRDLGAINSLCQLVLKMTCPGVPDIYQASLGWDLSLVDPDNRRPVDYEALRRLQYSGDLNKLWDARQNGSVKVGLTQRLLQLRKSSPDVFATGDYIPLQASGRYRANILSFVRRHQGTLLLVIVALHTSRLPDNGTIDWTDTYVELPQDTPSQWSDELSARKGSHEGRIYLSDVIGKLPFAVLKFQKKNAVRQAGILLPLTSLPTSMPVGDMGPSARKFADFLFRSGQKMWQMLPLNTIDASVGFSPYSSYSSIAGNPLLINVEDLVEERLLDLNEIPNKTKSTSIVDYKYASKLKTPLFVKAWTRFKSIRPVSMTDDFEKFLAEEASWLNNFALFEWIFRNQDKPWHQWPVELRDREPGTISAIENEHRDELEMIKWIQFIFFRQAKALRQYCNARGISLMGDLPFYVSHNSADVWVNRSLFDIDDKGAMTGIAGVPPDYFDSNGQLWGMPVYRWDEMKKDGYEWWTFRIKKNMELYNSLRLDHFRAFQKFWKVKSGETTAINGVWAEGPGIDLFNTIKEKLGEVKFVAEDLGDVDDNVFKLRDELSLPGMKVLQFAFGGDYPESIHLPHHHSGNFVVYTGTHDNNTSRGWYDQELSEVGRTNLKRYAGTLFKSNVSNNMIRMAYASVADTAIIPMQDVLNLPGSARMNTPSATVGNWVWRLRSIPDQSVEDFLNELRGNFDR